MLQNYFEKNNKHIQLEHSVKENFYDNTLFPTLIIDIKKDLIVENKNNAFTYWQEFIGAKTTEKLLEEYFPYLKNKIQMNPFTPPFIILEENISFGEYLTGKILIYILKIEAHKYILNFLIPTPYFEEFYIRFPRFAVPFVNSDQTIAFVIDKKDNIWAASNNSFSFIEKNKSQIGFHNLQKKEHLNVDGIKFNATYKPLYFLENKLLFVCLFNLYPNYDWLQPNKLSFKGFLDKLSLTLFVTKNDTIGTLLYLNENIKELTGYERNIFIQNKIVFGDLLYTKDINNHFEQNYMMLENEELYLIEYQIKTKEKGLRWIKENGKKISIKNEKLIIGYMLDITEQKEKEIQLKESEEKFRVAFDTSPNALTISDYETGKYKVVNKGFEKLTGYSRNHVIDRTARELHLFKDDIFYIENKHKLKKQRSIENSKTIFITKNGEERYGEISAKIIYLLGKKHVLSIVKNITEFEKTQRDFFKQHALLNNTLDALDEALIITDTERKIIRINNACEKLFGYKLEELYGKTPLFFFQSRKKYDEVSQKRFTKEALGKKRSRYLVEYITKTGRKFIGDTYGIKLYDKDNNWFGNLGLVKDVTEMQYLLRELKNAKEKAEESDKLKTLFLANMSHEIRTPMNGIIGFAQLLRRDNLAKEKKEMFLETINKSAEQLLHIINDIIDIAKLDSGQLKIHNEEFNINDLINHLYQEFSIILKSKKQINIELITETKLDDEEAFFYGDKYRIMQIITNFMSNSIKFTSKGYIKLGYELQNPFVRFYVKDTGIGINKKFTNLIFERFNQADLPNEKLRQGTGLGLSISKGLVNLMGGSIGLMSEEGKGSTFYFYLPIKKINKSTEYLTHAKESCLSANFEDKNYLIVDDNPDILNYFKNILSETKAQFSLAQSGKEAMDFLSKSQYDMIFLDLQMPQKNGYLVFSA